MLYFWICLVLPIAYADLRKASQPKAAYKVQQRNHKVPFQAKFALYMEPSDFMYAGLKQQRDNGAYDNFLRSNIDNEQDRRNFNTEDGKDHLPFRTYETAANDVGQATILTKMVPATKEATGVTEAGNVIYADVGVPNIAPLRWNNPHSSELEMNIWIMNKAGGPYVIPVMKPSCSGEGYQDNVYRWQVPTDFNTKASCRQVGECVLQVYAHSVESRMYSSGTPIIVNGGTGAWDATNIQEAQPDPAFNLKNLRRICLPTSEPSAADDAKYPNALIFKARLSSDVYNHAYQNSDFSPYAGQQPNFISQNLQASCILKMTANNFGELGKQYMKKTANEARDYANKLDKKARGLIRNYETTTNSIINAIKKTFYNTHAFGALDIPATSVMCTEWRDQWDRRVGGRYRGNDRTGGYCAEGETCYCNGDCYLGFGPGDSKPDAVCVKMVNKTGADAGKGLKVVVEGSEKPRGLIQRTETCFRCAEVGSTKTNRQNTNTYIPSFEIQGVENCNTALSYIAPMYLKSGFLTNPMTGKISQKNDERCILQIYMAVLTEMWPEFRMATTGEYMALKYENKYNRIKKDVEKELGESATEDQVAAAMKVALKKYTFNYRGPMMKTTTTTMDDTNGGVNQRFRKLNDAGEQDGGYYSAKKAWPLHFADDSTTSHDVPDTAGPLESVLQSYTNIALTKRSKQATTYDLTPPSPAQASAVVFKFPPDEVTLEPAAGCVIELTGLDMEGTEISAMQVDMDGLNYDADCDNDAAIAEAQAKHLQACADIQEAGDVAYVCPDFEEPACHIPGQSGKLPGQMFTNDDGVVVIINNARSVVPSAFIGLALAIVAAML